MTEMDGTEDFRDPSWISQEQTVASCEPEKTVAPSGEKVRA